MLLRHALGEDVSLSREPQEQGDDAADSPPRNISGVRRSRGRARVPGIGTYGDGETDSILVPMQGRTIGFIFAREAAQPR